MRRKDEFTRASNELVRRKVEYIYRRYQLELLRAAAHWKHGQHAPFYGFDVLRTKAESERQFQLLHANIAAMYEEGLSQLAKAFDVPYKRVEISPPSMSGLGDIRRAFEHDLMKATGREVRL